ncbi:DUF5675 family protein [Candidatus Palauibacter sp.]|uniref:DUF5675 family protein n=1 Tax=Candidatus Palauibacter sp. TaxID=3101350 RepID=UPI003B5B661E
MISLSSRSPRPGYGRPPGRAPRPRSQDPGSCIPAGGPYPLGVRESERFPYKHVAVESVPGRSNILLHHANWGGDSTRGFKSELRGCIAPGLQSIYSDESLEENNRQPGVRSCAEALARIVQALENDDDRLWIAWASHVAAISPRDGPLLVPEETQSSYPALT